MDALKREKKNEKAFHCNHIAQIISEICVISRRQMFNIRKNLLQLETYNLIKNETPKHVFACGFFFLTNVLACIFIKNETPAQVLSCKFCEIFEPTTFVNTKYRNRCFPANFAKFYRIHIL